MPRRFSSSSMRSVRILIAMLACWLSFSANASAQTPAPPIATASQGFGFDYKDADLASGGVLRFEMQVDTGAFVSVSVPPKANDAQTPAGSSTYRVAIPPMVTGPHSVIFRACNATVCSVGSAPFAFVLSVQPAPPSGTRILGS